jgi:hypothetical protein
MGVALIAAGAYRMLLTASVWTCWCARGRDVLVVSSDSPIWKIHMDQNILDHVRTRAVILNWSERKTWRTSLATMAFRHFGGRQEFNPLVIVFRPFRPTEVFRFWQPFQDHKHGNNASLERLEKELFKLLWMPSPPR